MRRGERGGRRVLAAALLTVLAGCGTPSTDDAAEATPAASSSAGAEDGIGAGEAKDRGVFVNDYDARLELVRSTDSAAVLTVTNAGNEADRYTLTVDPAAGARVTPAELALEPGQEATVEVEFGEPATVRLESSGRGDEVAAVSVP